MLQLVVIKCYTKCFIDVFLIAMATIDTTFLWCNYDVWRQIEYKCVAANRI